MAFQTQGAVTGHYLTHLQNKEKYPAQGIFFDGQIYDAYTFIADQIRSADKRIILIDNYLDDTVLTILDKRKENVEATIYTSKISKETKLGRDGSFKVMGIVKKINEELEGLTVELLNSEKDKLKIVDKISGIHGMLVDLLM